MKIEEKLSEIVNEVEVPDELLPKNIAVMLKEKSAHSKMEAEHKNITSVSNVSAKRRTIIMKTAAAAAACAVFAAGMWIYRSDMDEQEPLDARITYEATSPESYDEFYKIYTGITLNGIDTPDSERTVEEDEYDSSGTGGSSVYDFSDASVNGADVIKRDGNYLYCLKGKTIHIISLETMEEVSTVECPLDPPFEFYIEDGELVLISKEKQDAAVSEKTAAPDKADNDLPVSDVPAEDTDALLSADNDSDGSDSDVPTDKTGSAKDEDGKSAIPAGLINAAVRTNAAVDIFDVSDPATPVRAASFKQNGRYVSSMLTGGVLYTVTAYSNYRVKPLDTMADLDSFVPAYYVDGKKEYLAANDIMILPNASSTAYTVISAVDIKSGLIKEIKAVLGADKYICCSSDTLYIACTGKKDGKEYSSVYSFDLSDGHIKYRSSGSVEGVIIDRRSMNEYDGKLRVGAEITEDGEKSVSVYVLDRSLTVVNSAGRLLAGQEASAVRFEKNYARIINDEGSTAIMLDLSQTPPMIAGSIAESCLYEYRDGMLLGTGTAQNGLNLTMYADTGLALNGSVINADEELLSPALNDKRSVLIDNENGIIGIPAYSHNEFGTKNSYFVYGYDEAEGFVLKGVIEYMDVDDDMQFRRAYTDGDTLYIVSSGRVISARLSDLKVISVYNIK